MRKLSKKFRHGFKKMVIPSLFKNYVVASEVIQKDIIQTFKARGCNAKLTTVEQKFTHLMTYYPEFAFLFFWRIKRKNYRFKHWFTSGYECKIFGGTKIGGGLHCYH